ncbi:hypothetical protein [Neomegalonema sp.]|uniref:hypothetical protein n=1 Tax=Neomegalonema sp. TaxID=2039713 RepID=UPI00260C8296|nr:hypothetical protein [Neomegalonema sp.]MDD2868238.1 hypothetical protein [Neomegalonema sp.]
MILRSFGFPRAGGRRAAKLGVLAWALLAHPAWGGVRLERSALAVTLDGTSYQVRLKGRLNAPGELDLSDPAAARAWEAFVAELPRQPGYRQADLRVGGRADVEIRLDGELTSGEPILGLPFTQEPESEGNLFFLRLMEDGTVEFSLNPRGAEPGDPIRADVQVRIRRGIPLEVEGAGRPASGEPWVWRITSPEDPMRLRLRPPFAFFGGKP